MASFWAIKPWFHYPLMHSLLAYWRKLLEEVNAPLEREGHWTIDPNDPEMAARYSFPPPVGKE